MKICWNVPSSPRETLWGISITGLYPDGCTSHCIFASAWVSAWHVVRRQYLLFKRLLMDSSSFLNKAKESLISAGHISPTFSCNNVGTWLPLWKALRSKSTPSVTCFSRGNRCCTLIQNLRIFSLMPSLVLARQISSLRGVDWHSIGLFYMIIP